MEKNKKRGVTSKGDMTFEIVNICLMVIFCLFTLIPIFNILATALSGKATQPVLLPINATLFSFGYVLKSAEFYNAFGISIAITLIGTFTSVLCMCMAAYPLSKKQLPFRKFFMLFFVITMLFSGGMVPSYILMSSLGFTNTLFALVCPLVVQVFHLILMKSFFEGLPDALEESAKIDGANNLVILFKIIMPLSMSMIITVCLFTAVVYWNNYFNALLYIDAQHSKLYPMPFYITNMGEKWRGINAPDVLGEAFYFEQGIKSATIILSIIPIVAAYPFFLKYFVKGVAVGAVKG